MADRKPAAKKTSSKQAPKGNTENKPGEQRHRAKEAAEQAARERDATLKLGAGSDLTAPAHTDDRQWKLAVIVGDRRRWRTCTEGHILVDVAELGNGELHQSPAAAASVLRERLQAVSGATLGADEKDHVRWLVDALVVAPNEDWAEVGDIDVTQVCTEPGCGGALDDVEAGQWLQRAVAAVSGRGRVLGPAEIQEMFAAAQKEADEMRQTRIERRRERDRQRRAAAKKRKTETVAEPDATHKTA